MKYKGKGGRKGIKVKSKDIGNTVKKPLKSNDVTFTKEI